MILFFSGALEAHFVHFKSEYNSATNALTKNDGLAVFGVMFVVNIKFTVHRFTWVRPSKTLKIDTVDICRKKQNSLGLKLTIFCH